MTVVEPHYILHVQGPTTNRLINYFLVVRIRLSVYPRLLHLLIKHSLKIVQLLMDHGADPNLLCNGQCALSLALICGNDEVSKLNHLFGRVGDSYAHHPFFLYSPTKITSLAVCFYFPIMHIR